MATLAFLSNLALNKRENFKVLDQTQTSEKLGCLSGSELHSWTVSGQPGAYLGKENKYLNFTAYIFSSVGSNARDR